MSKESKLERIAKMEAELKVLKEEIEREWDGKELPMFNVYKGASGSILIDCFDNGVTWAIAEFKPNGKVKLCEGFIFSQFEFDRFTVE